MFGGLGTHEDKRVLFSMRYVSGLDSVSFQLNYRADLHFLFRCFPRKKLFFSFFPPPLSFSFLPAAPSASRVWEKSARTKRPAPTPEITLNS